MNKIYTAIFYILLTLPSFAQVNKTFNGVVTSKDKTPIEVFSIVIFNAQDSTTQLYANTFSNGNFNFEFTQDENKTYGSYILSIGYEDTFVDLKNLKDTIILSNRLVKMDDAVIQGVRDVKTSIGTYGGITYEVSNTYLSDMGTSAQLLNFIPGVSASELGDIKLLGGQGDVVIYINNVKITNKEKLLSLKSEDIKSVEVITSPGARFKGAKAVLYIKTNRAIDGFSSRVSNLYMVGDRMTYETPSAEMSYTKNKVTISGMYKYSLHDRFSSKEKSKKIDEDVYSGGWQIKESEENQNGYNNHWYSANINYNIDSKNTLVAEYSGTQNDNTLKMLSDQRVSTNVDGDLYKNIINTDQNSNQSSNKLHVNYIGDYSKDFNILADVDFSNRANKNRYKNSWYINDILTGETSNTAFNQNEINNGYAITSEILLNNKFSDKHSITYGVEHSFLHNKINYSIDGDSNGTSDYYLNSNYLKFIGEYTLHVNSKLDLTMGVNYMYNNLKNNNNKTGANYHNIVPSLSLKYYDPEKEMGLTFALGYDNYQPTASSLNDIIVTVVSPYEINRGNKDARNSIGYFPNLSFTYKKFQVYFFSMILTNDLINGTIVEDNNGKPLFVNTEVNHKKPITNTSLSVSYSNNISFWTTSIYASAMYANFSLEQADNRFEKSEGFSGDLYMSNQFKLPLNFYIYLNGRYGSRGYRYINMFDPLFNIDLSIEKRFFDNNLSIILRGYGIMTNKYDIISCKEFGILEYQKVNQYGNTRFISLNVSWRFNNHKKVQQAKDNKYLNML